MVKFPFFRKIQVQNLHVPEQLSLKMYKAKMYRSKTNKTTTIVKNFNILQKTVEKINENVDLSKMITKHNLINIYRIMSPNCRKQKTFMKLIICWATVQS